jgi:hypothetical protein
MTQEATSTTSRAMPTVLHTPQHIDHHPPGRYAPISPGDTYSARLGGVYGSEYAEALPYTAGHDGAGLVRLVGAAGASPCPALPRPTRRRPPPPSPLLCTPLRRLDRAHPTAPASHTTRPRTFEGEGGRARRSQAGSWASRPRAAPTGACTTRGGGHTGRPFPSPHPIHPSARMSRPLQRTYGTRAASPQAGPGVRGLCVGDAGARSLGHPARVPPIPPRAAALEPPAPGITSRLPALGGQPCYPAPAEVHTSTTCAHVRRLVAGRAGRARAGRRGRGPRAADARLCGHLGFARGGQGAGELVGRMRCTGCDGLWKEDRVRWVVEEALHEREAQGVPPGSTRTRGRHKRGVALHLAGALWRFGLQPGCMPGTRAAWPARPALSVVHLPTPARTRSHMHACVGVAGATAHMDR